MRRLRDLARLVMVGLLAYGIYWLWGASVWHWEGQVRISGNRLVSKQEILERLQVPENTPLYRLDPRWIASQVSDIPAVSRVAVRRWLFPARLEMNVIERQALVALLGPGNNRWMDQEGVVFTASPQIMKPRFGIKVWSDLAPGKRLPPGMQDRLFELMAAWPAKLDGRVDLRNPKDVYLAVDGWPVRFGELKDVPIKFEMLVKLKPVAEKYRDRLQYIDLRYPASPTFKLKSGAQVDVKKPPAPQASPSKAPPP